MSATYVRLCPMHKAELIEREDDDTLRCPNGHGVDRWSVALKAGAVLRPVIQEEPSGPLTPPGQMTAEEFQCLRRRLGTQLEASKALGLARAALQNYERGRRRIPGPVAIALRCLAGHDRA
jgi:DNA-binding transcriptional regulator YiaG